MHRLRGDNNDQQGLKKPIIPARCVLFQTRRRSTTTSKSPTQIQCQRRLYSQSTRSQPIRKQPTAQPGGKFSSVVQQRIHPMHTESFYSKQLQHGTQPPSKASRFHHKATQACNRHSYVSRPRPLSPPCPITGIKECPWTPMVSLQDHHIRGNKKQC